MGSPNVPATANGVAYLVEHQEAVDAGQAMSDVYDFFNSIDADFAAVLDNGRVLGICGRHQTRGLVAGRYGFALYSRTLVRDHLLPTALLVDSATPLRRLLELALVRDGEAFYEDVVLVDANGGLVGLVSTHELVQAQSNLIRSQFKLLDEQRRHLESSNQELAQSLAQQRDLERRVVAREKAALVETLASGIAHELNNKLMPIVGYSELLLEEPTVAENRGLDDSCRAIHRAALDSSRIIRQLLQLSRPSAAERLPCDLRELVEHAMILMNLRLREDDVKLSLDLLDVPVSIQADAGQIRQVITNLVLNAMDAMKNCPRRELGIQIRREPEHAVLRVSDTGMGIAPDLLSHIFDPFFTTKPPNQGTGLGLSVSQSIMRAHGGDITVESSIGIGTVFTIRLACGTPHRPEPSGARHLTTPSRFDHARALVVEDDDGVASLIVRTLTSKLGCAVTRVVDGEAACVELGRTDVDLLLSDVRMPGMDGAALLSWIERARPDLLPKLVFMTGDAGESTMNALILKAGVSLLRKPLTINDLLTHARAILQRTNVGR